MGANPNTGTSPLTDTGGKGVALVVSEIHTLYAEVAKARQAAEAARDEAQAANVRLEALEHNTHGLPGLIDALRKVFANGKSELEKESTHPGAK